MTYTEQQNLVQHLESQSCTHGGNGEKHIRTNMPDD